MPRFALLILILGLLAPPSPTGVVLRSVADMLASDSGDSGGSLNSSEPSSDRGWEIDPNG